ncbi:MAG: hypothetical protein JNJ52_12285 [Flavobacterium sp.]|nr:hypothetical protein [Flavobacterium sp.]
MKKFNLFFLSLAVLFSLFSCEKENDELTGDAEVGGLVDVRSSLVAYVVGNGNTFNYNVSLNVFQGAVKTTQIAVYKSFTNVAGDTSNEAFIKTITIPESPQSQDINVTVNYNELISGLTLNGSPLPSSDAGLNIGDFWTLKFVSTTSEGKVHANAATTKVSVGTRFAGTYKVVQGEYWRIGVYRPDITWLGQIRVVESVNATTYRFLDFAGPFEASTNTHYFTIDSNDVVRTPGSYNGSVQLLNGFGVINCEDNPLDMVNACGWSGLQNTVTRDDVEGKDRIYRSYGYYTTGSGPREFYEVLEKVVE